MLIGPVRPGHAIDRVVEAVTAAGAEGDHRLAGSLLRALGEQQRLTAGAVPKRRRRRLGAIAAALKPQEKRLGADGPRRGGEPHEKMGEDEPREVPFAARLAKTKGQAVEVAPKRDLVRARDLPFHRPSPAA